MRGGVWLVLCLLVAGCGRFGYDADLLIVNRSDGGIVTDDGAVIGSGTTYYVSTSGSDSNPGTREEPWRTLQFAADQVRPGDTVVALAGSYQGFVVTTSGLSNNPITFETEGMVTIDVATPGGEGIALERADYITIRNFAIDAVPTGIVGSAGDESQPLLGVRIVGVGVRGCGQGIVLERVQQSSIQSSVIASSGVVAIAIRRSPSRELRIADNILEGGDVGIRIAGELSSGGNGSVSEVTIERNRIRSFDNGIEIDGGNAFQISNNFISETRQIAILADLVSGGGTHNKIKVVNNTLLAQGVAVRIVESGTENVIFNNVLFGDLASVSIDVTGNFQSDHNAVIENDSFEYGAGRFTLAEVKGMGFEEMSFVASASEVFGSNNPSVPTPGASTPLVNGGAASFAGTPAASVDINSTARPVGPGFDIGAVEQ